jgi:hypothetical protein
MLRIRAKGLRPPHLIHITTSIEAQKIPLKEEWVPLFMLRVRGLFKIFARGSMAFNL